LEKKDKISHKNGTTLFKTEGERTKLCRMCRLSRAGLSFAWKLPLDKQHKWDGKVDREATWEVEGKRPRANPIINRKPYRFLNISLYKVGDS
jgi:hypothetical protein